ncbi:hypothetical protein MJ575_08245 [Klebsiella pneumoniae]|nr:hypothetical protein MJ575_08245 [Klebsiella pneumoniae]
MAGANDARLPDWRRSSRYAFWNRAGLRAISWCLFADQRAGGEAGDGSSLGADDPAAQCCWQSPATVSFRRQCGRNGTSTEAILLWYGSPPWRYGSLANGWSNGAAAISQPLFWSDA